MTKEECEYCADEEECIRVEHDMDCIFCECRSYLPMNDTCTYCLHDLSYCICPEDEVRKRIDDMIEELRQSSEVFRNEWDALLKSETE